MASDTIGPDDDIYCLYCGYNLRGLSGDPRRCPECGRFNEIAQMAVPAQAITAQLRIMEQYATGCVGWALAPTVSMICLLIGIVSGSRNVTIDHYIAGITCMVLGGLATGWYMHLFRRSCAGKDGWGAVIWEYMALGLPPGTLVLLVAIAPGVSDTALLAAGWQWIVIALLTGMAIIVVLTRYKPLLEKKDRLQREVAVEIATRKLHAQLRRTR